ncbi:hypothetical protein [Streptomyces sp. NPDC059134]|uniref:hypothetical protein n=1 Tax=Streptomyces sp. NPDC059134 TaxID=3346738 RepID=UPI0036C85D7E
MKRPSRLRALATLTVLVAGSLASVATPAVAGDTDSHVHIIGSIVQYAGDDNFNAGRDNTVGSNDGTAPATSSPTLLDPANWIFGL